MDRCTSGFIGVILGVLLSSGFWNGALKEAVAKQAETSKAGADATKGVVDALVPLIADPPDFEDVSVILPAMLPNQLVATPANPVVLTIGPPLPDGTQQTTQIVAECPGGGTAAVPAQDETIEAVYERLSPSVDAGGASGGAVDIPVDKSSEPVLTRDPLTLALLELDTRDPDWLAPVDELFVRAATPDLLGVSPPADFIVFPEGEIEFPGNLSDVTGPVPIPVSWALLLSAVAATTMVVRFPLRESEHAS